MKNPQKQKVKVVCPRCDGDGEEVGAPIDLEGTWLCSLCGGKGEVSKSKAKKYDEEQME